VTNETASLNRADAVTESEATDDVETLTVLTVPDYRDSNPYQAALTDALEAQGVDARTATGPGYLFPLTRLTLREGVPDVLHLHFFSPYMIVGDGRLRRLGLVAPVTFALGVMVLLELFVLRLRGAATVWTIHDLVNHERRAVRAEVAVKHVAARYLFDELVVHCAAAGAEFRRRFDLPSDTAEKFAVVPHGHFRDAYPDEVDTATARDRLDINTDGPVYLFFGWIRPYKNVPRLIRHFERIENPDARLLVVGSVRDEELEQRVQALAAEDDRVRTVLEFVPDEDVQLYMNAADVVVLPFRTDEASMLTSGSVLLAMGFENAVIAPDIGCIGAVLDEAGGICYDADADDQPLAGMRALADEDLAAMGTHNRRTVEGFEWDEIARRTLQVYREVTAA
jgi:glycosyltransferase involved in cell wall biosynthesis